MAKSGLFITLSDEDTLKLYLDKGIYGFLMPPVYSEVSSRSMHYHALADYACAREGTHVVFFLKRRIVYGGQIVGSRTCGAFYLNGRYSPLGRRARAAVCWDESARTQYEPTDQPGIFTVSDKGERCQPYLIRFVDNLGIKGKAISSDQLYWELGKYSYPFPSNTISKMSFCTLTPGEVETVLSLLRNEAKYSYDDTSSEDISIQGSPMAFKLQYGISSIRETVAESPGISEAQLEASVLANPALLPDELQPDEGDAICRQVPMCPFKPFQMDRVNICYYSRPMIRNGTIPNTIIELKTKRVGKAEVEQIVRYLKWIYLVTEENEARQVKAYLCGMSFTSTAESFIPPEYEHQINLLNLSQF